MSASKYLLRHIAYALAFFAIVAFGMEAFMPGSVMPYLDPVPFGLFAVVALGASALYPVRESRPVARSIVLVFLAVIASGIVFLALSAPGLRSLIAIVLISASLILAAVMTGTGNK